MKKLNISILVIIICLSFGCSKVEDSKLFSIGDKVTHKSNSEQVMVVTYIKGDMVTCDWVEGKDFVTFWNKANRYKSLMFRDIELEKVH